MTTNPPDRAPLTEPLAQLERQLIDSYLAAAGYDLHTLLERDDAAARDLLREAARYASARLGEIEARSHFVHQLHGES